jgi:6,7-dimethyl-8-ribityllumazine synthase
MIIQGALDGEGLHIGLAVATWNQNITDLLLSGATERCEVLGVSKVTVLRVPGALELPIAAQALASKGCDGVVVIGTVIKGDTDHYQIVSREASSGISRVALDSGVPITNAILAVHDLEQALDRAGVGANNKGVEAVDAAVITANALRALSEQ